MSEKELTEPTLTDLVKEHKSMWNYWQEHDEAVKEFRKRHIERALSVVRRRTRPMSCFNNTKLKNCLNLSSGHCLSSSGFVSRDKINYLERI